MTSHRTRSNAWKIFSMTLLALALIQCGDKARCDQLRDEFYQKRTAWGQCTIDEECYPLAGNPRDCTGVFSCPFAVHRVHREEAERAMLTSGADSVDCHVCAVPNCNSSDHPYCEPVTRQCVMIDVLDASSRFGPPDMRDVQVPPPPDDEDAGTD
jgi:hypothetical protein